MVLLAVGGVLLILFGVAYCTERVDNFWKGRNGGSKGVVLQPEVMRPPFRISPDQCVDCGSSDGPLSIDNGRCFWCFEKNPEA